MAFATSNSQTTVFGNLRVTYGQWSGAAADSAGSLTVSGGQIWCCLFVSQDASGAYNLLPVKYSVSGSSGVLTVTVYNLAATTAGRYIIVHS